MFPKQALHTVRVHQVILVPGFSVANLYRKHALAIKSSAMYVPTKRVRVFKIVNVVINVLQESVRNSGAALTLTMRIHVKPLRYLSGSRDMRG